MRTISFKIIMVIFCSFFITGCDWMYVSPPHNGICFYKTKGDYYHLVNVLISGDEIHSEFFLLNDNTLSTSLNKDTLINFRYKLNNGYVLDDHVISNKYRRYAFLSLTPKEYIQKQISMNIPGKLLFQDTLRAYILDEDPYIEFYECKNDVAVLHLRDSLKINQIIQNGEIEKYFKRLK